MFINKLKDKEIPNLQMNRYISTRKEISFGEVFQKIIFYYDDKFPCEFCKHKSSVKFINKVIKEYSSMKWYECDIKIRDLLNIYMHPSGWLRRYACCYIDCKYYSTSSDCIKCNISEMRNFTLLQCISNYHENEFSEKINNIQNRIERENKKENNEKKLDFLFCTIIKKKHNKYFVIDGNSRLLAYTMMAESNAKIKVYIGENQ